MRVKTTQNRKVTGGKRSRGPGSNEVDKKRKGKKKHLWVGCDYSEDEIHQAMFVTSAEEKEKSRNISWSEQL